MGQQSITHSASRTTATIANGAAVSGAIDLHDTIIGGIILPAAWTAAALTFEHSIDDGATWAQVFDDANAEVTIAAATIAARVGDVIVPTEAILGKLAGLHVIRFVSGVAGANVNQAAARDFTILLKS